MDTQPAAPAPSGYVVHMNNPRTNDLELGVAIGIAGIAVSTIFLLLRLYTRAAFTKSLGLDDLFITLSWALSMVFQGLVLYLRVAKQIGVHIWETTIGETNNALLFIEINTICFLGLMMFAKIALCLFYRRLSDARWFQISIWTTMAVTVSYSVAFILAIIFACSPLEKNWNITITDGECINKGAVYLGHTAVNAATDLVTLVLPIPVIVQLKLPSMQKFGVVLMFVVGSLTLVTSCVRLALLLPMLKATDITWAVSTPTILISIEASLVIVCICFPSLRLFLRRVTPSTIGQSSTSRKAQEPESAMEMAYKPKTRPLSELTLFKGRQTSGQSWLRMSEPDPMPSPVRSPIHDVSLEYFDFQLPKEVVSATRTSQTMHERRTSGESFRTKLYDWRLNS